LLSYRHSYHAGNFADVLKHIVLVEILVHLTKKTKPFDYIDTHSGAGLYNLKSEHAAKLAEYANGIDKLNAADWPELSNYFAVINSFNKSNQLLFYPGSPLIAGYFLRQQDKAWLYELHPNDFKLLTKNFSSNRHIKTFCSDGFKGMLSLLPPTSRRSLILIDPSYEIKADYDLIFTEVQKAYRKFATGIYAIWYPMVDRSKIDYLEKRFINSGIADIQRFELGLSADTDGRGMTSSGMIVINPPWGLLEKMSTLLPQLAKTLAGGDNNTSKCDVLVGENG
jgi:23S rRNA (adenine2030-N6)-methyltransferase